MLNKKVVLATIAIAVALVAQSPSSVTTLTLTRTAAASGVYVAPVQRERTLIWRAPGQVERLDLAWGVGGPAAAPKPPFTFVKEDTSGTNPKIEVRDGLGVIWGVKWGEEVNAEVFAARLVWAVGYFVEAAHYIPRGKIIGATNLDRAKKFVEADGSFFDARFEKKDKNIQKLGDEQSWNWDVNPFVGTKELNGLKVMMMLLSNWDSKDQHQANKGSNTKIFIVKSRTITERQYVVSDWGGTMGKWGNYFRRAKWDCKGYEDQSNELIKGVKNGMVEWAYSGQHTESIKDNISVTDVKWLMGYLGKLSDAQIRAALQASGATTSEVSCFSRAVRERITRLQLVR